MAQVVLTSLQHYFTILNGTSAGKFNSAVVSARYIVCAATCHAASPRQLTSICQLLGFSRDFAMKAKERWQKYLADEVSALLDVAPAQKRDAIPPEYDQLCEQIWHANTRPSEKAKDAVRDPRPFNHGQRHRIHYQELRNMDIFNILMEEGRRSYGDVWRYNTKRFAAHKPFYVRPAGRAECLCKYCLGFDLQIKALHKYNKLLKSLGCQCDVHTIPKNAHDFRARYTCPKPEGSDFYAEACRNNTCPDCKDWQKVPVCNCMEKQLDMKWEQYTKVTVINKHNEAVQKWDFRPTSTPFEDFQLSFTKYRKKYMYHHTTNMRQQAEFKYITANLERGTIVGVPDFSENGKLLRKHAQQDTHWAEHGYTVYPFVLLVRVEDLKDEFFEGGVHEKEELLQHFQSKNKLPAVLVNLCGLSDDTTHDNAFVQHFHTLAVDWIKENTVLVATQPDPTDPTTIVHESVIKKTLVIFSDRGPAHNKLSAHAHFISKHLSRFGITVNWNFMCSGHGKNWSDPLGGRAKAAVDRAQLEADDGATAALTTVPQVVEYLRANLSRPTKDIKNKPGLGLVRSVFFYIPASGEGSVSRRLPRVATFDGIKKLHQIISSPVDGCVRVRVGTCLSCPSCRVGNFSQCEKGAQWGELLTRPVIIQSDPACRVTRQAAAEEARRLKNSIEKNTFFACSPGDDPESLYFLYWATENGHDGAVLARRLMKTVAGSNHFEISEKEEPVTTAVVMVGVQMDSVEKRYAIRGQQNQFYCLNSKEHRSILEAVESAVNTIHFV